MKILVINTGSSSLKYQLFDMAQKSAMASGLIERIGEPRGSWTHTVFPADTQKPEEKTVGKLSVKDHREAMHLAVDRIADPKIGVIKDTGEIDAIGHRVVQGGETFKSAVRVDDSVKNAIQSYIPIAPLHNPSNLTGIEVSQQLLPGIPNVAVFDTQFHQTMPPEAYLYGLPHEYYEWYRVRRYGFHGTSHKYLSQQAVRLMGKEIRTVNLITLHLGNGCSVCAVEKGKSVDTSMGLSPLAGVMMGTRCGDIDPAVIGYLMKQTGKDAEKLNAVLNKESGLKGICGKNDFRDIHRAAENGDSKASLALEMFCRQVKKYIGAYSAVLGRVDAVVFSGGIGENDCIVREKICSNLSGLGIEIDAAGNNSKISPPFALHSKDSRVDVWVIPTNEELQIAAEVFELLQQS